MTLASGPRLVPPVWPLPNVWLGVSAEDQERADERIPILLDTPAAVRFVSLEPLLGPIDIRSGEWAPACSRLQWLHGRAPIGRSPDYRDSGLGWVIVGGESGPHFRPMEIEWLESIVNQCRLAGVPVFVKQDSGPRQGMQGRIPDSLWSRKFPA